MPGPAFLHGDRLTLRTVEREDIEFIQRARNDPETRDFSGFRKPNNREQVERFYEEYVAADNGDTNLLICLDNEPIGGMALFEVEADHGQVAYWLVPDEHGEGYATEAVSLLLDHAFRTRGLHRVYARVFEFNDASQGLLEKLGFTQEGRLREHTFCRGSHQDVLHYGLLAREWETE